MEALLDGDGSYVTNKRNNHQQNKLQPSNVFDICQVTGDLAYQAMMLEAHLTPKPGLVDCDSSGAHSDMDITTFVASSNALKPFMHQFVQRGYASHNLCANQLLAQLRPIGIAAEQAMFAATNNVNTHKGMIFTLGVICGSIGWLAGNDRSYNVQEIRKIIIQCCANLVADELTETTNVPVTAGEKLFQKYGLTGIRGEASLGYPTIFEYGLPVYLQSLSQQQSQQQAMTHTLFSLMANNVDTNLVSRGGLQAIELVQSESRAILSALLNGHYDVDILLSQLEDKLVELNLSPGGSADLLAATWLLAQFTSNNPTPVTCDLALSLSVPI
ncbi:triphosphoribosyl-dephospho-CoA synthase CitG [Vibrio sp. TH_r3]|uniref:triphosphoribosyl-dephospho-CoA synthase CitG n=1 Tax=Vibrio sp. TH_r3 TaxID=3082084 RepID=UPI0039864431